ncbi:hypothetical protein PHYSODRAFT_343375 [Plasmopara halstedii]|uniref:HTH psq-type domain-containing protein n=1 Tax=Plasmopara halstedii TaxID=4781 RepID=A0A0P1AUA0_PLAHL|nr:hypothetical protein PHYSODRAFT_343375 [Plasmopara halstedii]CEG44983.1 hypothetical protein PHYSODRAFT_343375 [Plasmopara halstedii]|eukprot:XP_024581352.1 hypothetical protein PHYSODRAFT_343375 [Plasmopara halstedii]
MQPLSLSFTNGQEPQSPNGVYQTRPTARDMQMDNNLCRHSLSFISNLNTQNKVCKRAKPRIGLYASQITTCAGIVGKRVKKKYLKERERCEIVRRVRGGEKQAHLAKEFGVSRAAVCYLLKHQMEIMQRSSQLKI